MKSKGQRCPKIYAAQTFQLPLPWLYLEGVHMLADPMFIVASIRLAGGHSLGHETLKSQLLLLEVLGGGVLNLELGHSVTEGRLDLLLVATLQLHGHSGVRHNLLDTGDVGLELLARLETLGESLVAGLELGSI